MKVRCTRCDICNKAEQSLAIRAVNIHAGDMKDAFEGIDALIALLLSLGVKEETIQLVFRDIFWGINANDTM